MGIMPQKQSELINFRDEKGLGAFPNETPLYYQLFSNARRAVSADPVPVPPIVGDYVLFLDLSKWQGEIDFELMYARGIRVVWIKVSQGEWIDPKFEAYYSGAIAAGLYVGVYHFADPEQTSIKPEIAADKFYKLIEGRDFISIWLDCERTGNLNNLALLNFYLRWWETIFKLDNSAHVYEDYTRFSFFNSKVARSNFWFENSIRVNAARYHLGLCSPWCDGSYIPLDWNFIQTDFNEWQYSADGNGLGAWFGCESGSVDLNAFRGSWNDFEIVYRISDEIPPPITCPRTMARIINSKGLNFRESPNTSARVWFALPNGYENIAVLEQVNDGDNLWLRTGERQYCAYIYQGVQYCELYETEGASSETEYINLVAKERFPLGIAVDHDKVCAGEIPKGKPTIEHPPENERIIIDAGQVIRAYANYKYSCKDNANDPFVLGSGLVKYYVAVDGYPGEVSFIRKDKVKKV